MMNTEMPDKTHELVRDLFIFSTFTGLTYSDVKNLTEKNCKHFLTTICGLSPEERKPTQNPISVRWMYHER